MTAFESHFSAIKKALMKPEIYDAWPDFEPIYDENEYARTTLRGLGETLLLNCGECNSPSDMRHSRCDSCVIGRGKGTSHANTESTGRGKDAWSTMILCSIHSPDR